MALQVSIGQACANALASYLRSALTPDVVVYDRWPEPSVPMFASPTPGGAPARAAVSVVKIGKRVRSDAWGIWLGSQTPIGTTQADVTFLYGGIEQPMQIDIWAKTDDDRDDLIAQFDNVLYAGLPTTVPGATGDPVRDGILVALGDGFSGYYADYWFDSAEIGDSPDSTQIAQYRATYFGEARTAYGSSEIVALAQKLKLSVQASPQSPPPAGTLYQQTTLTPNPNPPPAVKVTSSSGTTP